MGKMEVYIIDYHTQDVFKLYLIISAKILTLSDVCSIHVQEIQRFNLTSGGGDKGTK